MRSTLSGHTGSSGDTGSFTSIQRLQERPQLSEGLIYKTTLLRIHGTIISNGKPGMTALSKMLSTGTKKLMEQAL